ncbi:MAG: serine hydrolase [Candidatus Sumerlaeota bacterium]|nr:serine hydrolase [Candidatus Sumerlaeota bacterium]
MVDAKWWMLFAGLAASAAIPARSAVGKTQPEAKKPDAVEQAWLDHGFTEAQREAIRAACRWGIENKFVPGGSLLLMHRGETVFREGFGVADLESGRPFAADLPCRIASITKPHTATMIAMLVEQGKFGWDDPIDKYLPYFAGVTVRDKGPAPRMPKIHELLSHTAGFAGKSAIESGKWEVKRDGSLEEAVKDFPRQGLAAEPGTVFAYTAMGYMVAARIAEVVTGKEYPALMEEMLLRPIGATTATFHPSEELEAKAPVAYDRPPSGLVAIDRSAMGAGMGSLINPAGSLISTLDDVGRFLLLHRNHGLVDGRRVVAAESLQRLYRPWRATAAAGYGLGFNVLKTGPDGVGVRIQHTGASGTLAQLDFERDYIVVLFTQVRGTRIGPFRDQVLKAIRSVFAPNEQPAAESPDREGE